MSSQPSGAVVAAAAASTAVGGSVAPPPPPAPQPLRPVQRPASTALHVASSPAQTNISLPTGETCSASRKRPREEEEDTPRLATDTTATPSNTPPTVSVPVGVPGICASALDAAAASTASSGSANDGSGGGAYRSNSDDGRDDEVSEAMAHDETNGNGESEEEEVVLPDLPPEEHRFRHTVDARKKLGCRAHSPDPQESLYWKITEVSEGSQAEALGMLVGHYFISINGERLVGGSSLTSAFQRAVATGKSFEVVTSDFPVQATATINNDSTGQQQQSGNAESEIKEGRSNGHDATPRTKTPDPDPGSERGLAVSPAIRRAMMVQNSPASKSPYHTFDQVLQSIVPGPTGAVPLEFGVLRGELRRLIKECTRRLCIFPQDDRPWLDYALNLVFASLWYNAPDRALGWNLAVDEHRVRGLGIRAELKGPQPWMATRAFIVRCIQDMLEAEDNDWIGSSARRAMLKRHHEPRIKQYLKAWNSDLSKIGHSQLLQAYADHVWNDFVLQHVSNNGGVDSLYKLTERWIVQSACSFAGGTVASIPAPSSPDSAVRDRIRSIVVGESCSCASNGVRICKCKKLSYELYPFAKDRGEFVVSAVLRRFQENRKTVRVSDVTEKSVRSILDDMEDETGFITKLNGLLTVTVAAASKVSSVSDDTSTDVSATSDGPGSQADAAEENRGVPAESTIEIEAHPPPDQGKGALFSSDSDALSTDDSPKIGSSDSDNVVGQQQPSTMSAASASGRYSTTKEIRSRVYARFTATDDEYYWGTVISKNGNGLLTVLFDDGIRHDVVDDDACVITEKEYACLFNLPPLPPPKHRRQEIASNDISGRGYCHTYTDKEGNKQVIYGVVSRRLSHETYNVDFDKDCLAFVNDTALSAGYDKRIEQAQELTLDRVLAGCIAYDRSTKAANRIEKLSKQTPLRYFVVPEMRHEEQVECNGMQVPMLTVVLRGRKFVFSIKKSSTRNHASLGLFVKCTSLLENKSALGGDAKVLGSVLKKAELLDMGVFHENSCCFFKYVNRCGPKDVPTVHEEFDPEGEKHYFFGVRYYGDYPRYKSESSRVDLVVDGDEVEIFLDTATSHLPSA